MLKNHFIKDYKYVIKICILIIMAYFNNYFIYN